MDEDEEVGLSTRKKKEDETEVSQVIWEHSNGEKCKTRRGGRGKPSTLKRDVVRSNSQSNGGGGSRKKRMSS